MRFTKMQGIGNDFVVLDAAVLPPDFDLARFAQTACDRHFGIGADGLLVVGREEDSSLPSPFLNREGSARNEPGIGSFAMRMFNPDGTEDMCGNGLRCAGLWALRAGWIQPEMPFLIATKEGDKSLHTVDIGQTKRTAQIRVDMGLPKFAPADIPFCAPPGLDRVAAYPLNVAGETYPITSVNTGSTHTVIFGALPDEETFQRASPLIENHPLFPQRTTVLWAYLRGKNAMGVRIWERGVGETLGCGTGACAVAVAAQRGKVTRPSQPVQVISEGGVLWIDWPGEGSPIAMTGPAEIVYDGDFALADL